MAADRRGGRGRGPRRPRTGPSQLVQEHFTDLGNAKRFVRLYGRDLRYIPRWKKWLVWDGTRFRIDESGAVVRRAKETVLTLYGAASGIKDDATRNRVVSHATASEAAARIKAMIELAGTESGIAVEPSKLDADPWLLNCQNGTLNLQTGKLEPHDRSHLITKLAPVNYDPKARDDRWHGFLARVVPDEELREFLKRRGGYTLTGDTREEDLAFLQGTDNTGKTTMIEALARPMGDYAMGTPFTTLLKSRKGEIRNDIARLAGARLVIASEVPAGQQFDEQVLKQLTGRDTVSARFLYGEFFDFRPQFKIWIAANHRPRVRDDDPAVWRRMRLVPFMEKIPEKEVDKALKTHLTTSPKARAAILAWAVEGCLAWQRDGLPVPESVRKATEEYRTESDAFGQFLDECFMIGPDLWEATEVIVTAHEIWCERFGVKYPLSHKGIADRLRQRGHQPEKRRGRRGWRGLARLGRTTSMDASDSLDSSSGKSP